MTLPALKTDVTPQWAEGLDPIERQFVENYLVDLNGTEAMLRINPAYSRTTAAERASVLKSRQHVLRAMDMLLSGRNSGLRMGILDKLVAIADADMGDFLEQLQLEPGEEANDCIIRLRKWRDLPKGMTKLIKSVKVHKKDGSITLELHDKLRALEILGKLKPAGLADNRVDTGVRVGLEDLIRLASSKTLPPELIGTATKVNTSQAQDGQFEPAEAGAQSSGAVKSLTYNDE